MYPFADPGDSDDEDDDTTRYCICNGLASDGPMIQCDVNQGCANWFHIKCMHIKPYIADVVISKFFCTDCTARGNKSTWRLLCSHPGCMKLAAYYTDPKVEYKKYCSPEHHLIALKDVIIAQLRMEREYIESRGGTITYDEFAMLINSIETAEELKQLTRRHTSNEVQEKIVDLREKFDKEFEEMEIFAPIVYKDVDAGKNYDYTPGWLPEYMRGRERDAWDLRDNEIRSLCSLKGTIDSYPVRLWAYEEKKKILDMGFKHVDEYNKDLPKNKQICGYDERIVLWEGHVYDYINFHPEGRAAMYNGVVSERERMPRDPKVTIEGMCPVLAMTCRKHRDWRKNELDECCAGVECATLERHIALKQQDAIWDQARIRGDEYMARPTQYTTASFVDHSNQDSS
jgi:hypothetical protein